jgi:hypothetical protein
MFDEPKEMPQPTFTTDDLEPEEILESIQYVRRGCTSLLRLLDGIQAHLLRTGSHVIFVQPAVRTSTDSAPRHG